MGVKSLPGWYMNPLPKPSAGRIVDQSSLGSERVERAADIEPGNGVVPFRRSAAEVIRAWAPR